jgi:hypothetical protein
VRRIAIAVLLAAALARPAASQDSRTGNRAFYVGLVATAVPTAAGVALLSGHGSTAPGLMLASAGVILGPSVGDWSGGLTGRGLLFAGLRAATAAGGLLGVAATCWDDCSRSEERNATTIAVASSVVLAGLVAWDLATVKSAVRRHQERRMSVTPLYDSVRHGPGLVARVTF